VTALPHDHGAAPLRADPGAAGAFWDRIAVSGSVHEARALTKGRRGPLRWFGKTASGYFNSRDAFSAATGRTSGQDAVGVYMSLNPVNTALLGRGFNKIVDNIDTSTSDQDVVALRRLLIDVDPERPSGISASDEEQARALVRRDEIWAFLRDTLGWGDPLAATSSGNGAGLIYDIDLPNDPPSVDLVKQTLGALDRLFSDTAAKVDTGNYNPSRITRVAGTVTAKGDHFPGDATTPARPWRLATAAYPAHPRTVTATQLRAVVAVAPEPEGKANQSSTHDAMGDGAVARTWTVEEMLALNGLQARAKQQMYGRVFQLDHCLTSDDHTDGACIIERTGGALVYTCRHARCQGKNWRYLREHNIAAVPANTRSTHRDRTAKSGKATGTGTRTDEWTPHDDYDANESNEYQRARDDQPAPRRGVRICLADVQAEEVTWLWPGRIPYGKLTLLVGDPGLGKSFLSLYLASRLSTGSALQGETERPPQIGTLLLSAEDDLADTIRPRLDRMGANVAHISAFRGILETDEDGRDIERMVRLDTDLAELEHQIEETGARFVVVDPINAYLGTTDGNQDIDLRRVLNPLAMIAARHKVAMLVVTHSNKRSEGNKLHRVMGSLAYVGLARSVLAVGADPDVPGRCNMVQIKNNLAEHAPGLGYRIVAGEVVWDSDPVSLTADTVFDGAGARKDGDGTQAKNEAANFLRELLATREVHSEDVYAEGKALNLSKRTIDRAKADLGIKLRKEGFGKGGKWYWSLPQDDGPEWEHPGCSGPEWEHGEI